MAGWGVIPSIRVRDMKSALEFYEGKLGFEVKRGGPDDENCSLDFGDAHIMLETAGAFYSPGYNEAIKERIGEPGPGSLYIEATDLDGLWKRVGELGLKVVDPIADRPWGQSEFTVEDPEGLWLTFWRALPAS